MFDIARVKAITIFDRDKQVAVLDALSERAPGADPKMLPSCDRITITFEDSTVVMNMGIADAFVFLMGSLAVRGADNRDHIGLILALAIEAMTELARSVSAKEVFPLTGAITNLMQLISPEMMSHVTSFNPEPRTAREAVESADRTITALLDVVRRHIDKLEEAAKQTK